MKIIILKVNNKNGYITKITNDPLYKVRRKTDKLIANDVLDGFQLEQELTLFQARQIINRAVGDFTYEQLVERIKELGLNVEVSIDESSFKIKDMVVSDVHGDGVITQMTKELLYIEFKAHSGAYYKSSMRSIRNSQDVITKKLLPNVIKQKGFKCK